MSAADNLRRASFLDERAMMLLEPFDDLVAHTHRKRSHGGSIGVRHGSNPLVTRNVPLLPKGIECRDSGCIDADSLT